MRLFVDGRDISHIELGDLDTGEHKKYSGEPETYLQAIDDFLRTCGKTIDSLTEGHIMIAEGSVTALRASLAIMNTIHFVSGMPLIAYKAPREEESVFKRIKSGDLVGEHLIGYAAPAYDRSPRITPTRKDHLNRKL